MALDGVFLHKIKNEISSLIGAHTDKIYQPSRDELVFLLRSKEGAFRLLISARQGAARLHTTASKPENPANPPMFCMLLRKHLGASKLISVQQKGFERILTLTFSSKNEMGDTVPLNLVCEFIGSKPNIILTDENNVIIDAVHRSDIESSARLIQPGAIYELPAVSNKLNIIDTDETEVINKILSNNALPLWKAILDTLEGFSPLIAREIALKACGDFEKICESLNKAEKDNLIITLSGIKSDILVKNSPVIISDQNGYPFDYTYTNISQYGEKYTIKKADSFCDALDIFYTQRENEQRIKKSAQDIFKILTLLISRTERKIQLRKKDLEESRDREKYRIYGELIKANLYRIPQGASTFDAENYYDENFSLLNIPLDPSVSPAVNADRYFKEYKKSYTAEKKLCQFIEQDAADLKYFNSVLDNLSRAQSISDLEEIREELNEAGVIKIVRNTNKKPKFQNNFKEYKTPCGLKILVGKNNRQNDVLTLNIAAKNDIWFHTKNIPGSHTVLVTDGKEVSQETLMYAAGIAAYNSKAQNSSGVPVDYTLIKYVKKPNGAKPGMVIYSNEKTLFVTPKSENIP